MQKAKAQCLVFSAIALILAPFSVSGKISKEAEHALRDVKRIAILPAVVYIENEKIEREFTEAAELVGFEAIPLSEQLRPEVELELLKQLRERLPFAVEDAMYSEMYFEAPVACDSTMWSPKWKMGPDSVEADAFILLEVIMIHRSRVNSRCTVFSKGSTTPLLSVAYEPKHKKEYFDPSELPGPVYDAIKEVVKKLAKKWPKKK